MFLEVVCLCGLRPCTKARNESNGNIVCLCGLQWLCLLSVGDLPVNVSAGRMSLRTAATQTRADMSLQTTAAKTRENPRAILYVFADCNGCVC